MRNKMKSAKALGKSGKKLILSSKLIYFLVFLFVICLGIERAGATVPSQYIISDKAIKMGNTTPLKIFNLGTPEESTDATTKQYVDSIATGTGAIGLWMSNGVDIYNNNSGNVGIGSTIPSAKLDVAGDIRSKGISSFLINTQNEGIAILYPETANTYTRIGPTGFSPSLASGADDLAIVGKLEVAGIGYFNYNVGIGTTGPTHHLEVIERNDGYGDWSHGVLPFQPAGVFIQASNVNSAGLYGEGYTRGVWGVARANGGSGYGILGEMGSGECSWPLDDATGGAIVGVTNCSSGNSGVAIRATVLTGVEGYGIYSQGNLSKNYFEGNVGLGSTTPAADLDINGNAQLNILYDRVNSNYHLDLGANTFTSSLTVAGNIGIGVTNPGYKLSMADTGSYIGASFKFGGSYVPVNIVGGTNVGAYWRENFIGSNIDLDTTTGKPKTSVNGYRGGAIGFAPDPGQGQIHFFTNAGSTAGTVLSERMVIDSAGNVGIGMAPSYILDVTGGHGAKVARFTGGTSGDKSLYMYADSGGSGITDADTYKELIYLKPADNSINFYNNGSGPNVTINATGKVGIGTTAPNSTLHVNGSFTRAIVTKTSTYTATASDDIILCDASGGGFVITLPTAVGIAGREYTIKKIDSSANQCGYTTTSGQTIDGVALTYQLGTQWQTRTMVSDGTNWIRLSNI
ncbi:MAG: hypothetical protein PHF10_01740 [Patescibacteria group bacterium]|nr:hypothetical protein [Patescibacteria group bacterium]MDD5534451.1 hypothetical protein [Patescibacteria group bacterium]